MTVYVARRGRQPGYGMVTPPDAGPGELLAAFNWDQAVGSGAVDEEGTPFNLTGTRDVIFRQEPPRAPGMYPSGSPNTGTPNPRAYDRIRVVPVSPGSLSDPRRPAGKCLRVELRPKASGYNASGVEIKRADGTSGGDVQSNGLVATGTTYNRAEVYDRKQDINGNLITNSVPAPLWPDPVGTVRYYRTRVFFPEDHIFVNPGPSTSTWCTITQWKGAETGSPKKALEVEEDGTIRLGANNYQVLGRATPGQWMDIVTGFYWSTVSEGTGVAYGEGPGWAEAWVNGVQVLPRTTMVTMETKVRGGILVPDPSYWKWGIYRSGAWQVPHVLHFGEQRVGTTYASVTS
jgi:hypothetical protein